MAALTSKARKQLKSDQFAIPSKKAYPIDTENRGRNALARVSQFGTPAEKAQVSAAVHNKFPNIGKKKSK